MSSLPPAYTNGNILDASELNLQLGARDGDITPIDPGTRNELDDTYDIGSPTSRFKDGNFSNQVTALNTPRAYFIYNLSAQTIQKSRNIDSIVRTATGAITVNITASAFTDGNYIAHALARAGNVKVQNIAPTATEVRFSITLTGSNVGTNSTLLMVGIFEG